MDNYSYNSSHPESGHSSPQSRETDFDNPPPWDDSQGTPPPPANYKVKFMCSYGGKIHPRPHDNQLSYIGGETKILAVDRNIKFAALLAKLMALCDNDAISFKYQLPGEDLDALISVTNDDDLEHMMHEYDRLSKISSKPARLRIFIFPCQNAGLPVSRSFGSDEAKTDRFVEALNSAPIIAPPQRAASPAAVPPTGNADFLFGLDKGNAMPAVPPAHMPAAGRASELEDPVVLQGMEEKLIGSDPIQKHIQDLQRLRIEEQQHNQGIYRRKSDDNLSGGITGGEYYKVPEKISQVPVASGVPSYWTEKQVHGGVFPSSSVNNEHSYYMIPAQAGAFHPPIVRPPTGTPTHQGYYTVQRIPPASEPYRDQHHIYNMISQSPVPPMAAGPPQKVTAYAEGHGMVRQATPGVVGLMAEAGYTPLAYDGGGGRQVIYTTPGPGGVMGCTTPVQSGPGQYQAVAGQTSAAGNVEGGTKVGTKVTQTSV